MSIESTEKDENKILYGLQKLIDDVNTIRSRSLKNPKDYQKFSVKCTENKITLYRGTSEFGHAIIAKDSLLGDDLFGYLSSLI